MVTKCIRTYTNRVVVLFFQWKRSIATSKCMESLVGIDTQYALTYVCMYENVFLCMHVSIFAKVVACWLEFSRHRKKGVSIKRVKACKCVGVSIKIS